MQTVFSQPAAMWRADAAYSPAALGLPGACTGPVFSLCAINRLPESLVRRWLLVMFHGSQCEPVAQGPVSQGCVVTLGVSGLSAPVTNQEGVSA